LKLLQKSFGRCTTLKISDACPTKPFTVVIL
jgi:hypothetical protein